MACRTGLASAAHDDGVDRARGYRHGGFGLTPQTGVALVVRATCRAVGHEGGLGYVGGTVQLCAAPV